MNGPDYSRDHALAIWFGCVLLMLVLPIAIAVTR